MKISVEILEEEKERGGKSETPRDIFSFHCNFGDETGDLKVKTSAQTQGDMVRVMSCM